MANRTKKTPEKIEQFLEALRELPDVTAAAQAIGMSRSYMYALKDGDPAFSAAWDAAIKVGLGAVEAELLRRAVTGIDEPVFYQGARVDTVKRKSDVLLMFYLKAHMPEKYRERVEVGGIDGSKPIKVVWDDKESADS